ncbi:taste receptor type 2 member 13-like [Ctenodactylus gundi]
MESGLKSFFSFAIFVLFVIGTLGNGFIVLLSCVEWFHKRKLSSIDQILTVLAISRIGLIWEILACWFQIVQFSLSYAEVEVTVTIIAWIVANHFSLWLATVLSIFYLLKIGSFSSPLFLYLKWRVKKVILATLLGTLVFLVLNLVNVSVHMEDTMHQNEGNMSWKSTANNDSKLSQLVIFNITMFSLVPFTVTLISILLLIFSLWKHLRMMQLNSEGPRDPRTKAHVNALKIMVSFLLLYASYLASLLLSWVSQLHHSMLVHTISLALGLVYPSAHSFVLILGNPKLSISLWKYLRTMQLNSRGPRDPGTEAHSTLMSVVFFWSGSSYLCTACTTCLSVFYVFKIAHFSHPIFLWMKHRMRKMLLIIMLGTILTFCTHVIVMNTLTNSLIPGRMEMSTNSTLSLIGAFDEQLKHQFLLHMTLVILFVVSLTSFLLLIFSLWSHSRRMKLQGVYSRDSSTEAHVRAMRAMALYLFLFVMHYVSNVMMLSSYSTLGTVVTKNFAQLLIFFYPSGHPFLLILWNKKLKQAFLCVLGKLKCVREKSISHSSECT